MICLTADVIRGARERYMAEGFDDYLSKPIEVEALQESLATHLPEELTEWKEDSTAHVPKPEEAEPEMEEKE